MTVRLHLGAHKTATTQIQRSLDRAVRPLRQAGLAYFGPKLLRSRRFPLADALAEPGSALSQSLQARFARWRNAFPELLLSDENIIGGTRPAHLFDGSGTLYPEAGPKLSALLSLLGEPRVTVFLSLREPSSFLASAYGFQLRRGNFIAFEDYMEGVAAERIAWTPLVAALGANPLVDRVVIWRYEDFAAVRDAVVARLVGDARAALVPDAGRPNTGISQSAYDAFVERAISDDESDLRDLLAAAMKEHPKLRGEAGMNPLGPRVRRRCAELHEAELARIATMPRVEMISPASVGGPSPAETAAAVPADGAGDAG